MQELTIVAVIRTQPQHVDRVKPELLKLVAATRTEAGCLQYDLHQDNSDPARFLFFERWKSRDLWQAHMQTPHLAAYRKATEGAIAEFTLFEMSQIA
ncbi:MAG: hypothetical protein AMXMBFR47_40860 [Planctomycetota bacterium]